VHATTEDKNDDTKNSFYEELECLFDKLLKSDVEILLGEFSVKVRRGYFQTKSQE
jgi:hypothetical protein